MRAQQNAIIANAMAEMMARKGRLVPLPTENEKSTFDPEDVRGCSRIAARELMKEAYRDHFDKFAAMVNQTKLEIGKNIVAEGSPEIGNKIIQHEFSQDEIYDIMFDSMEPEEANG